MRSKCQECYNAGLECELDCYPCSNCIERGFSDTCPGERSPEELPPHCIPDVQPESLKDGSQQPFLVIRSIHLVRNYMVQIFDNFCRLVTSPQTKLALRYLYLPVLLFLPIYYFSQASTILGYAEKGKEEYEEWTAVMNIRIVNLDNGLTTTGSSIAGDIELQVLHSNSNSDSPSNGDITPEENSRPPAYSPTPPSSPLVHPSPPPPPSVNKVQDAWINYLDSRTIEWRIVTTTACVFVAASPTIFQIPDASDDPITRSIAFLALCRALSGIIYGPIFPLYFRRDNTKTVHFAMLWYKETKQYENSVWWGPWVMLSLPAVATCWATIFYLLAIFSFIWRTGSTADPSEWSTDNQTRRPMSVPLALALRIAITFITVVDLICMAWIWRTLRRYNRAVWRERDEGLLRGG